MFSVFAREQDLAGSEHLGKYAAHRPDVDGGRVIGHVFVDELRSSIPASSDVIGPKAGLRTVLECSAGETKVTDAEVAS